LEVHLEK